MEPEKEFKAPPGIAWWEDIFNSGRDVVLRPQAFFQAMSTAGGPDEGTTATTGGYLRPLLFASVIFLIVMAYNVLLMVTGLPFPNGQEIKEKAVDDILFKVPILYALWMIGLLVGSAVLHLSFRVLKGRASFQGTFRVFAYSTVANFLSLVPVIGQYLSTVYALVLIMFGGRYVHGLSSLRAIAAPLLPALLAWAILIGFVYVGVLPLEKLKEGLRH